ncbi:MAG TPA: dihydrolipoamide acetyltransferase family protein [Polyangiaceae bacterium]|nr:dihydrolipoamide acetyltransferase family protein [Polyangiaceae bacterium]
MSQYEFKLPDIGEGVTEGEIVGWLVNEGDTVSENQEMVEIMTDKATVTIGAPKTGRIAKLRGKPGDVVPVGEVLVVFDLDGEGAGSEEKAKPEQAPAEDRAQRPEREAARPERAERENARASAPRSSEPAERSEDVAQNQSKRAREQQEGPVASAVGDLREALPGMPDHDPASEQRAARAGNGHFADRPLAAPATRRLARELGVDLKDVKPSGASGRVTREDIERHREHASNDRAAPAASGERETPAAPRSADSTAPPVSAPRAPGAAEERIPVRGLRKRIFENMARSKHTAAHFTYVDECDAGALRKLRERFAPHAEKAGVKLSYLPFIIKATVLALKKHPALNCLVDDQAQELVLRKNYDVGVAVATDAGLTVAALRQADRLSLLEIARELARIVQVAREGKLRKEDLGGTSFTITSLGKLGGLFATPIVNYPEVAILGVHEIKRRPVVQGDQIVIGDVMLLSLSFDHRVIDGHIGAAFAQEIIGLLQDPDRLLLELS